MAPYKAGVAILGICFVCLFSWGELGKISTFQSQVTIHSPSAKIRPALEAKLHLDGWEKSSWGYEEKESMHLRMTRPSLIPVFEDTASFDFQSSHHDSQSTTVLIYISSHGKSGEAIRNSIAKYLSSSWSNSK